jgi:rSAM/selenodomain-associated transferase 2
MTESLVSVIIPVLNEGERLAPLLRALMDQPELREAIVVDGGSVDDSVRVASDCGARVIRAERGRGAQLRAGAEVACGDILLFLHADTVFPSGGLGAVRRSLADRPVVLGGNFKLLFDGPRRFDRWLEGFYAWIRSKGLYYGDSGIFIRRERYRRLGGIRPIALMEDYDLVQRMEAAGPTVCIEDPSLTTSSRRFHGRHPVAIFLGWVGIHALYRLGLTGARLARLYDSERRRERVL